MKKTKRFAAMIAALTMTACAGTMNLSAKAEYGNSGGYTDIFFDDTNNSASANNPREITIASEGHTESYMGGTQSIYTEAGNIRDGVIDLKVNVTGEDPTSTQEIKEIVAEDIWCIDVESDGCTWHVENTGPTRYYFVKWDPVTQLYGVYIYNTENESGNAQSTVDSLRVDGQFGFDDTVHNVKFTNKSNFQVKLTATVLDSEYQPVLGWDNSGTFIENSNDQFMCGFATKTSPNPSFYYQDDVILNHPVTSAGVSNGADESKNYLDANQTQRAILKVKLKEGSEFFADKTGRIVVNFTKPTIADGVMTDDLYAPLNNLNYLSSEVENYTISGSATAEQLASRAGAVSTYSEANPRVWTSDTLEDSLADIADGAEDWWE